MFGSDLSVGSVASAAEKRREAVNVLGDGAAYIGGKWIRSTSMGRMTVVDPSTGQPQAEFSLAGPQEVDAAVAVAKAASAAWREVPADERRRILLRIAAGLRGDATQLTDIAALETGQPRFFGGGAAKAADYFEYYAGWVDKLAGEFLPVYPGRAIDYTVLEPCGVAAAIVSWNGPVTGIGRKVAPALAAGNTVVLKPAEIAPFAALRFARICEDAGLPNGVLSVVPGSAQAGAALTSHPDVDVISFTGSPATARTIINAASAHLTRVSCELGGKSANIIFDDADLEDSVAYSAFWGAVQNSGQGCSLPTRLLVQESVYDEVVERVVEAVRATVIGDPLVDGTQMGPVISGQARDRILATIREATDCGAGRLVCGGGEVDRSRLAADFHSGFFLEPTVFADVDNRSDLAQREIFGPVLAVARFRDEAHAIQLANDSRYGLAAYINSSDINRCHRLATGIAAGYVSINGPCPMPPSAPFGGLKDSGTGREGGAAGIHEFLRPKNVYIALK